MLGFDHLVGFEAGKCQCEQRWIRVGTGEQQLDAPGIAQDDGTDAQQRQAQGTALGAGQPGSVQHRLCRRTTIVSCLIMHSDASDD